MQIHFTRASAALFLASFALSACTTEMEVDVQEETATEEDAGPQWVQLFNGVDLEGWTPKITHHELGENFADTFRVEDGVMKIGYEGYGEFGGQYGHIFWKDSLSNYRLRVEYRFLGDQAQGGAGWAFRNSGVMLHCQDPASMTLDQEFPASIEAQMLGGGGEGERATGNLCTPGTNVVMNEELVTRHCTNSTSLTYHGDQWVTLELEVRGNEVIRHWMDGKVVLEYNQPQLDPNDSDAKALIEAGAPLMLEGGYISLQSESHPLEFRKVELLLLED